MELTVDLTKVITELLLVLLNIIGIFIAAKVTPWLRQKGLDRAAANLVRLAYTMFSDGEGKEKLDYVTARINEKFGKWFDAAEILAAIQAAYVDFCTERGVTPGAIPSGTLKGAGNEENEQ